MAGTESLQRLEAECAKGRTAPRVTLKDIEGAMESVIYVNGGTLPVPMSVHSAKALDVLSICVVVLKNGFTIIGKSAPADPANFDRELGEKLAYDNAVQQIWPLMGFALREHLARL